MDDDITPEEPTDDAPTNGEPRSGEETTADDDGHPREEPADTVEVAVRTPDGERTVLAAPRGRNLRDLLVENDRSPYTAVTRRANCGGRGLCGTCGVRIEAGAPAPDHWHDRLADRFGYPRLSCQVTVDADMAVEIPPKVVWGRRDPDG